MKNILLSLRKKTYSPENRKGKLNVPGTVRKRKIVKFGQNSSQKLLRKRNNKKEEKLIGYCNDNLSELITTETKFYNEEIQLNYSQNSLVVKKEDNFSTLVVRDVDEIQCTDSLNQEDEEMFYFLKNLSFIFEGTSELLTIGHVKNSKLIYIAYDLLNKPKTKRLSFEKKWGAKYRIERTIDNIFLGEMIHSYHGYYNVINILLTNIISHSNIKEEDLYDVDIPCEPRRENIKHYLYQCIRNIEPKEIPNKEFEIPSLFKDPRIVERITRFSVAFNELLNSRLFEKIQNMRYYILPFSARDPHPIMKILGKIMMEEITNKKTTSINLYQNKDQNQMGHKDLLKTVFVVSSSIPCNKCQLVLKELKKVTQEYMNFINPCYVTKQTNDEEFILPDFIDEFSYKDDACKNKNKAFISIGSKLKEDFK